MEVNIYEARKSKRIVSAILDVFLFLVFALALFIPLDMNMYDIGFKTNELKKEIYTLQIDSGLFSPILNDKKELVGANYLKADEEKDNFHINYINGLKTYYFTYKAKYIKDYVFSNEEFNKEVLLINDKLEHPLFIINDIKSDPTAFILKSSVTDVSTNKLVETSDKEAYKTAIHNYFYDGKKGSIHIAVYDFFKVGDFTFLKDKLSLVNIYQLSICFFISSFLYFLLIPMFFKNGETIFMFLFNIGLCNTNGIGITKVNTLIRGTLYCVLITFSVYLYVVPIILNVLTFFFTKGSRSLLDFASNTIIIDTKISRFYKSKKEANENEELKEY